MLAQVDQIIARNRNIHSYVTAARLIADDPLIYDQNMIYVHAKMQHMSLFVLSVGMAYILLTDGLEMACDDGDLGSAYGSCGANITVDKFVDQSACRVVASYKTPHACDPVSTPGLRMIEVIKLPVEWMALMLAHTPLFY